jgi:hypothetical protein
MVIPSFSHGHIGLHSTYGHEHEKGAVPNNFLNANAAVSKEAGHSGYVKGPQCQWPRGGYTRKEAQHRVRNGVFDTSPQSFEFVRHYRPDEIGLTKGVRNSNLTLTSGSLTQTNLARFDALAPPRTLLRPESAGASTSSTLGVGVYHQTKVFVPRGKPPIGKPPSFAARPMSAPPDPRNAIAERRAQRAWALQQWERETSRPQLDIPVPMPGSRPQSAIDRRPRTLSSPPRPEDYRIYAGRERVPMPPPPLLY